MLMQAMMMLANVDIGAAVAPTATVLAAIIAVGGGYFTYRSGRNQAQRLHAENESVGQRKVDLDTFTAVMARNDIERKNAEDRVLRAENKIREYEERLQRSDRTINEMWRYLAEMQGVLQANHLQAPRRPPSMVRMPWQEFMPDLGPLADGPDDPDVPNGSGGA